MLWDVCTVPCGWLTWNIAWFEAPLGERRPTLGVPLEIDVGDLIVTGRGDFSIVFLNAPLLG